MSPRVPFTGRTVVWALTRLRRENAPAQGLARRLAVAWARVWRAVKPVLEGVDADESRVAGVPRLRVGEHTHHHGDRREYGPLMLTGMVDLGPGPDGRSRARLPDLVEGRSG